MITLPLFIGYPPAPSNGGPLLFAPPKIGEWAWQPKIDDWRGVAHAPTKRVWTQYGDVSNIEQQGKIAEALIELEARCKQHVVIEGEQEIAKEILLTFPEWFDIGIMENRHDMMRGSIIVFDAMDTTLTHRDRRLLLETMFPILPIAHRLLASGYVQGGVYLINEWRPCEVNPAHRLPMMLQELLQRENAKIARKFYEGLVAKREDVPYMVGLRPKQKTSMWVKHRFDQG